jgi:hypothetical protein
VRFTNWKTLCYSCVTACEIASLGILTVRDLLEASVVRAYVDDLKALLSKGSIVEQKSFLRSFVKRIAVNLPQVVITYTMPLKTQKVEPLEREVLPFAYDGSPSWTHFEPSAWRRHQR